MINAATQNRIVSVGSEFGIALSQSYFQAYIVKKYTFWAVN